MGTFLLDTKVPKLIFIMDGLPMTPTGKIQKFVMRDKMIEQLGT